MCAPDPNAGRREAARVENNRRHAEFKANSIKQWNKESSFKDNIKTIRGLGRSRDYADFQEFTNQAQGKALLGKENLAVRFLFSCLAASRLPALGSGAHTAKFYKV